MTSAEEFAQLKLKFIDPIQHDYEVIRPMVLYAETLSARSEQTEIDRRTINDKARRFVEEGMLGLMDRRWQKSGRKSHPYPDPVATHILYVKYIYPPIGYRELVRIVGRRFGYKTNHHTIKHFLEQNPIPIQLEMEIEVPRFRDFEDAYRARWTVVHLYYGGWNKKSIAGYLQMSRQHVHTILDIFKKDHFAGLEDKRTRPVAHPANQLTLPFLKEVLDVQQEYPRAGRFRVHGLLEQRLEGGAPSQSTVGRAMALNRQFHDAPGPWYSKADDKEQDATPKYLPYRPQYRHQFWYVDVRYLVKLNGKWVYSLCIIEGYSRTILAGMASEYQDQAAILQILHTALSAYGCPEKIVSDNAAVFYADQYTSILKALSIEPKYINKGQPWENLIESQFKIQLRLLDAKVEKAQTVEEVQNRHAEFVDNFNRTSHWTHQDRPDQRKTPKTVLAWAKGRLIEPQALQRLFQQIHFPRSVNRYGFVSIQRFYIYVERGLSRQRVSIWIYEGSLRVEYQQTLLARYACKFSQRQKSLQAISQPALYQSKFQSPQLTLFELDEDQWHKILPRPYQRSSKVILANFARQLPLSGLTVAACLILLVPFLYN